MKEDLFSPNFAVVVVIGPLFTLDSVLHSIIIPERRRRKKTLWMKMNVMLGTETKQPRLKWSPLQVHHQISVLLACFYHSFNLLIYLFLSNFLFQMLFFYFISFSVELSNFLRFDSGIQMLSFTVQRLSFSLRREAINLLIKSINQSPKKKSLPNWRGWIKNQIKKKRIKQSTKRTLYVFRN